ncbi:MAG: DNA replication and repair protein RecF, partial [Phaeodactylibacter sp.]|nr:DNA replication and repair protein RecF [Phaeodactylibacter sp.]
MYLQRLILTQFKNYDWQRLEPAPKLNFLVGKNGMGKTNLLDAIYYLCMGKSYFVGNDRYLPLQGTDLFRLEGHFVKEEGRLEKVVAKVQPGKKKVFEYNDRPYERLMDHVGLLPVVIIAPDDTALAMEGSEERRRFLDNTLCQINPDYLRELVQYNKVLQQRNAFLKQNDGRALRDTALLDIYDEQLAAIAPSLFKVREDLIDDLGPVFQHYQGIISNEQESVGCRYRSQLSEENYLDQLRACREKDIHL